MSSCSSRISARAATRFAGPRQTAGSGPDLTHLESRTTLGALTIPNREDELAAWIRDPQRIKPGNKMPALDLSASDLQALVAYLESLR